MAAALVTGASRGIGQHFARVLDERGYDLVLVARDGAAPETVAQRLREDCVVAVEVCPADLSSTEGLSLVRRWGAEADVLINNAGAGTGVPFDATQWTSERDLLRQRAGRLQIQSARKDMMFSDLRIRALRGVIR
ncbi:SDR family NAD(P)-dependent oxidoreductase [Streptomyces sp. NPDC051546]|uniref:SDR family NAD(P)-dependent oxidoreductase n=1 Tax=Streptomyces sp. NPDC051546 TaxID=3365655 RepID=UPI0037915954